MEAFEPGTSGLHHRPKPLGHAVPRPFNPFLNFSSNFNLSSDVTIKGNLLPENNEEPAETCCELETYLAKKFEIPSSVESKKMRKELQKVHIVLLFVCLFG